MSRQPIGVRRTSYNMVNGVTDRVGMPRIGKLRLGEKGIARSGNSYPKETDYFRCDPEASLAGDERQELIAKFTALYGEQPKKLTDVYFPTDEREFVFPNALESWKKNKRFCHGNGVTASRLDFTTGEYTELACCHVAECPIMQAGDCKLVSRLRILLPSVTLAGYWQIDTSSQASTGNVLDAINQLHRMFGRLTSIPLVLSREPREMVWEGKANTHYILNLRVPNVDIGSLKRIVSINRFALNPGSAEIEIDDSDIPEELVPLNEQEGSDFAANFTEEAPDDEAPVTDLSPAEDPSTKELRGKIDAGFALLKYDEKKQREIKKQFRGDLKQIYVHLSEQYRLSKREATNAR